MAGGDGMKVPWWWLPLVGIDVETTGFRHSDRIVSLAVENWDRGVRSSPAHLNGWTLNPGIPIPADASRIHGIRDSDVREAPGIGDIAGSISGHLRACIPVAYNAPFDRRMLQANWKAAGLETPSQCPALDPEWTDWIDPLIWVREYDRLEGRTYKSYRLETVAKRYDIELDAHQAASDIAATMALLPVVKSVAPIDLMELLTKQGTLRGHQRSRGPNRSR